MGAGGFGRETAQAVAVLPSRTVAGFADDDPARHGTLVDGLPVLGGVAKSRRAPPPCWSSAPATRATTAAGRGSSGGWGCPRTGTRPSCTRRRRSRPRAGSARARSCSPRPC
ncbi:hypothetical protein [Spirillospora sp. NPDC029432]|uniref:hypothetical protein n=1 Tax=Spirillospora sp. NPDC029432 TaxID=3154599 RepID=UPI003453303A